MPSNSGSILRSTPLVHLSQALKVKFLVRALGGLFLALITLALIGVGVWRFQSAVPDRSGNRVKPVQERTYNVGVATLETQTVVPVVTAFGQVSAARMLEIRAAEAGPIVEISPNFRNGVRVSKDELLFQVDPTDFKQQLMDANVTLTQSRADSKEARDTLPLSQAEVKNARRQVNLRQADLKRKAGLQGKGFVAQGAIDEARIAVTVAQQSLNAKRMAEIAARARIRARDLAVQRAKIAVNNAERSLTDTSYRAPFSGPLTQVSANLGKRLSPNEKLGVLIDSNSLEVSFTVTDAAFGRLIADESTGALKPLKVIAELTLGERIVTVSGELDRAASVTDLTSGGREVFARIATDQNVPIRPGDFVTVRIAESALENVVSIPASAATNSGEILLLTDEDRLESHQAQIVRRQDESIIVNNVPVGREFVTVRQPFLATGVKVRALRQGEKPKLEPNAVELTAERRDRLVKFISSRKRLPQEMRERILKALGQPKVATKMVDRIEARMKQMESSGGATR